jgi:hypothetical protein
VSFGLFLGLDLLVVFLFQEIDGDSVFREDFSFVVFPVRIVVDSSVSEGNRVVFISFVVRILIFSFLFFGFSFDFGHGVSAKIRKALLVVPVEAFVVKIAFRVVFADFVKVVHVKLSNPERVPV